jgi:hypothetical protein
MIMRNANTGALLLYDIANNQITGAAVLGTVGLDWQFAGVAPIHAPGASDLILRNVNTGASRCTTSPTIKSSALPAWDRWDWSGSLAVSPPTLRPHQWVVQWRTPLGNKEVDA